MRRALWFGLAIALAPFVLVIALVIAVIGVPGGPVLAPGTVPAAYSSLIERYGNTCPELTPARLAAQLYQESQFEPDARSTAGAQGIAQFMPATWQIHGLDANSDGKTDPWDPEDAIPSAAAYDCHLAEIVGEVPGDLVANMLAAYNAGPNAVLEHQGIPPFPETRGYVTRIKQLEKAFEGRLRSVPATSAGARAIAFAFERLGTPYLWGGEGTPEEGGRFDCSGLTQAAYRHAGMTIPRTSRQQWYAGEHVELAALLPGDLVFFAWNLDDPGSIHHVGIYVGNGYMIDAPYSGAVIRFDRIDKPDYIGAVRPTGTQVAARTSIDRN